MLVDLQLVDGLQLMELDPARLKLELEREEEIEMSGQLETVDLVDLDLALALASNVKRGKAMSCWRSRWWRCRRRAALGGSTRSWRRDWWRGMRPPSGARWWPRGAAGAAATKEAIVRAASWRCAPSTPHRARWASCWNAARATSPAPYASQVRHDAKLQNLLN